MPRAIHHLAVAATLILFAILWRFLNTETLHLYNLELITATTLVAAVYLPRKYALLVPLATVTLSDAVMGNSSIYLFTWSAFAITGLAGLALRRLRGHTASLMLGTAGIGLASTLWFFLWTNAGVWLQGYYAPGLDGLLTSYTSGLPFLHATLVSGGVLAPAMMLAATLIVALRGSWSRVSIRQNATT